MSLNQGGVARVVGTVLVAAALGVAAWAEEAGLPDGARGFSGHARGVVKAKGEKGTIQFTVGRVEAGADSKAANPQALVGQTISVGPRYEQAVSGEWRPVESIAGFIGRLQPGNEATLKVRNVERDEFAIVELTGDAREAARRDEGVRREGERGEGERREAEMRRARETEERARRETEVRRREGGEGDARREGGDIRREGERREGEVRRDGEVRRPEPGREPDARERETVIRVLREEMRQLAVENAELRREIERLRAAQGQR